MKAYEPAVEVKEIAEREAIPQWHEYLAEFEWSPSEANA